MEFVTVKSHDGVQLNASIIKPRILMRKKSIRAGLHLRRAHAQVVRNTGWANFLWHELMAQKGYIIFSLDNRGSAGRGHAFETPLHFRMGGQELSDQLDGVQYLKSLSYVDANRIGIWGWS